MKKIGKVLILFLAGALLSGACSDEPRNQKDNKEEESVLIMENNPVSVWGDMQGNLSMVNKRESLVQVQSDINLGSALLWEQEEDEWIFVTAAHVVENTGYASVYFRDEGENYDSTAYVAEGVDLAFLSIPVSMIREDIQATYAECLKVSGSMEQGEKISAIGYDSLGNRVQNEGSIAEGWIYTEDFTNCMMLCNCEASEGMSGGGIYGKDGFLAGMICGKNEQGIVAALPTEVIKSQYQLFINN